MRSGFNMPTHGGLRYLKGKVTSRTCGFFLNPEAAWVYGVLGLRLLGLGFRVCDFLDSAM